MINHSAEYSILVYVQMLDIYLMNLKNKYNILENGYCGNEKIADIINEDRFTGWNKFNSKTTRTRTKL